MGNINLDQASAFGGGLGGFSGLGGAAFGVPVGVPVGGYGGYGGGCNEGGWGGLVGLAIAASIFGNGGFGGRRDHDFCRDGGAENSTAALATVIAALNDRNDSARCEAVLTAILAKAGTLEGAIPALGCELQMAIQNAVTALLQQNSANAAAIAQQFAALQLSQQNQTTAILASIGQVDRNVDNQGCATREAICAAKTEILSAFANQTIQGLRDQVVILSNDKAELLSDARHAEHRRDFDALRINIENTNTAVAAQQQRQDQRQVDLTFARLERDNCDLRAQLAELIQINRATNQNILVGNTGVTTTGPQNANPTNVNAR